MNQVETSGKQEVVVAGELVELSLEQIESVVGGALLLPAVQKVREAPAETMSLNFEK